MNATRLCMMLLVLFLMCAIFVEEGCGNSRRRRRRRQKYYQRKVTLRQKQKKEAKKVSQMYKSARTVSPNYYAITLEQARNFTPVLNESNPVDCLKRKALPKYAECKLKEVTEIVVENTCEVFENRSSHKVLQHTREVTSPDGSITFMSKCKLKGRPVFGTRKLRLCTECPAMTILPADRFPRYLNEIICSSDSSDSMCISGQGTCVQQSINLQFKIDEKRVGIRRLGEWSSYPQSVRTGCVCRLSASSTLKFLL